MQIRRAKPSDVAGIRKVHALSVQSLGPQDYPGEVVEIWSRPRSAEDYRASIAANSFYVAEKEEQVIGFAELEIHKKLIRSVYVSPSHTRQGVASALLAALEDDARQQGLDEVWLHSSLTAVPFYEASGFDQVQTGRFDLGDGLDMASVKMRKVIRYSMSDSTARSRADMPEGTNTVLNRRTLSGDHRVLALLLEPGMRVLDVGCGTGAITEGIALAVAPGKVVGTDINDALLAEANRRDVSNLRFHRADVYDLPWNEEFDLVTSSRVLQWLDNPGAALTQMKHCIRREGCLVVLDYNHEKAEWRPPLPDSMASFYRAFLTWRAQSGMNNAIADDLERLLLEAGFRDVVVEVSDEVSNRTDSDFREKVDIWKKVAETRGQQVVKDGYFKEKERASASRDFETWLADRAEYQRLYLRTAIGRKMTSSIGRS